MNFKIVSFFIFISFNLYSQNLCEKKYAKIIKENSNIYTLESNLKPIKIEWKIKDSIYSTKEITNYSPKDSIVQLALYPNRLINYPNIYYINRRQINTFMLFSDSFIPIIKDIKNTFTRGKLLHSSRRRFHIINNRVFLNQGLLFEYKNGLYYYVRTDSLYNQYIFRQRHNYISPYNQILHYHILNADIIGDYLLDNTMTYIHYSSKKFNHFYTINLNTQSIDSIPYFFKSELKSLKSDVYILNSAELNKKCAITKMQFVNKDSILFSDSCFLGLLDLKNKASKTIYQFSNEIIHFNIYQNNVYFLNNFSFYYQSQDSFTKFFYYKYDIKNQKLDSTEIVLQGKIDSSSFIIDAYNNITCIRYQNTANADSSYNTSIMPHKRWAKLVQFNIANIQNQVEFPTIENDLKHYIASWDAETNLQMDCNGDILFQGTKENDTLLYWTTPPDRVNDSLSYKNESLYKIVRKIDKTFIFDSCEQIKAVVYFADGDTLHTLYSPHCGYINKNISLNVCDSIKINAKNYYETGLFIDTIFTNTIKDTILSINLKINKSKHDTIKVQTCNIFKFGDSMYSKSGIYTHNFTLKSGCDSLSTLILDSKEVNAKVKLENGTNFTALIPNASYQWYVCNPWRKITNAQKQTFSTTTKGSYAVVVSNLGCIDTSDCIALYSSGLNNASLNLRTQVFPIPFDNVLNFEFENFQKTIKIKLFDILGKEILNKNYNQKKNIEINVENINNGSYYLQIETDTTLEFFNVLKNNN